MLQTYKKKFGKDANLKELVSGSAVTLVIKVVGLLASYVVTYLISHKYGAAGTGVYSMTTNLLNSIALIGGLGLNVAVLRYIGQFNKSEGGNSKIKILYRYIFEFTFPLSVLIGLLLFFGADFIAIKLFGNPTYIPALKVSSIALPFFTLNLIEVEFIRGLKLIRVSEYLRSVNRQLIIITLLFLPFFHFGILDAIYGNVVGVLITFFISFWYISRYFKKNEIGKVDYSVFSRKELFNTSFPMLGASVSSFLAGIAGSFFLEYFSTSDKVGIYNVCYRLATFVNIILVTVNTVSAPKFSELYWSENINALKKIVMQSSKLIFWVSFLISLVMIAFSSKILGLFGQEFIAGKWVLILMVIAQIVNASTGSVGLLLNMSGHQKKLRNIISATTIFSVVGNLIMISLYNMIGAAIVATVAAVIRNVAAVIIARKHLKINSFYIPFITK